MATEDARDRLRRAVHDENDTEIKALGWTPVFAALERMWAKRMDNLDRLSYATVLGDLDPHDVLAAVVTVAREGALWRPKAPALAAVLGHRQGDRTNAVATAQRQDRTAETLRLVGDLLVEGAYVCVCKGRCSAYSQTVNGVVMCLECGGLEPGQAEDAIDASTNARETAA